MLALKALFIIIILYLFSIKHYYLIAKTLSRTIQSSLKRIISCSISHMTLVLPTSIRPLHGHIQ